MNNQTRLPLAVVLRQSLENPTLIGNANFQKVRQLGALILSWGGTRWRGVLRCRSLKLLTHNKPSTTQKSQCNQSPVQPSRLTEEHHEEL